MEMIGALIAVGFGWALSQATDSLKNFSERRRHRKNLLSELTDIEQQLERIVFIQSRMLQFYAHRAIEPSSFRPIPNSYFKHYFSEAFRYLSREQRISYQLIHSAIDDLNEKALSLPKFTEQAIEQYLIEKDREQLSKLIDVWGDRVIASYKTAQAARWHIQYHIQNENAPTLDILGKQHKRYVEFEQELTENVEQIISQASDFDLDDLKNASINKN